MPLAIAATLLSTGLSSACGFGALAAAAIIDGRDAGMLVLGTCLTVLSLGQFIAVGVGLNALLWQRKHDN